MREQLYKQEQEVHLAHTTLEELEQHLDQVHQENMNQHQRLEVSEQERVRAAENLLSAQRRIKMSLRKISAIERDRDMRLESALLASCEKDRKIELLCK